ncbi:hypothetical protein PIROE2DRAFT_10005 [Piromyces sp. E2]|nr:hypothetical protein PIROE2DRAFT_10005 [Piromyces sp. E2]|eukprot:OUM63459.1 hypothetical protein PIROE2DRAFT_10005 [Piromyces sp. E2]
MRLYTLLCLALFCSMQLSSKYFYASAAGDIGFAENIQGHLRIFNKKKEIWNIKACRYNIIEKYVFCEAYLPYKKCLRFVLGRDCIEDDGCVFVPSERHYRLRIKITKTEYKNKKCQLKDHTKFKQTRLVAQSNIDSKFVSTQTLCSCSNKVLDGKLPKTLNYDTFKQKFIFVTQDNCEFHCYYDEIKTSLIE